MHTHFSAIAAGGVFLAIIIMGTFWRLLAAHACASSNVTLQHLGQAMSFQY